MSSLFLILFAVLTEFQFLSLCLINASVIVCFSTFLTLHCDNNSSSLFFGHSGKIIINKDILNDG